MAADASAFAAWAGPALVPMARLARRLAPHDDPDDLVQDALARAWAKRRQYDAQRGSATTWLLAIVADVARASRRTRARWLKVVDDTAPAPEGLLDKAIRTSTSTGRSRDWRNVSNSPSNCTTSSGCRWTRPPR
jgi:RNA polymerase sigma-70 factor (ECF subfamily)